MNVTCHARVSFRFASKCFLLKPKIRLKLLCMNTQQELELEQSSRLSHMHCKCITRPPMIIGVAFPTKTKTLHALFHRF